MIRVGLEDDKDEDGDECVCALVGSKMADQACLPSAPQRGSMGASHTKDDLTTVENANKLVSRGFVVIDLDKL